MATELALSIYKVVAYFDIFEYPVTIQEIYHFLDRRTAMQDLKMEMDELNRHGIIYPVGDCFSLKKDPSILEKRASGNIMARQLLATAQKLSRFLYAFPFVRGIGISGSLSKNMANEKSDIDYFIITKANRLWISRSILHAFKKLTFLTGHQHWFCMNYFIDEEGLQIEEKNIFTATELVTLLPVSGSATMQEFYKSNQWATEHFPNHPIYDTLNADHSWMHKIKLGFECIFQNRMGDWLDNYLMRVTTKRWNLKEQQQHLNIKGNRMGIRTGKHFSKPNPSFFQQRILRLFNNRLSDWPSRYMNQDISANSMDRLHKEPDQKRAAG